MLDISRAEVADYLFDKIDALLREQPIDYLKWDHNRDLTTAGWPVACRGYRAQVHALYALLARLRAAHPEVEIESCSGGGGRIDFAVLRHTHRVWTSDCIDALSRVDIQRGFLQFFPPEIMGAHVGTAPAHTTGRTQGMALSRRGGAARAPRCGTRRAPPERGAARRAARPGSRSTSSGANDCTTAACGRAEAGDGLLWQAHGDAGANEVLLLVYRVLPSDVPLCADAAPADARRALRVTACARSLPAGEQGAHWCHDQRLLHAL